MELYPFDEVVREAGRRISRGVTVFQQFACARCGSKQTMDEPNMFYIGGRCEECGALTDIRTDGSITWSFSLGNDVVTGADDGLNPKPWLPDPRHVIPTGHDLTGSRGHELVIGQIGNGAPRRELLA